MAAGNSDFDAILSTTLKNYVPKLADNVFLIHLYSEVEARAQHHPREKPKDLQQRTLYAQPFDQQNLPRSTSLHNF